MAVYQGMLEDTIREWSIGFGVVEAHKDLWTDPDTGDQYEVRYLDELELLEISAVMAGANRFTETLAVKSTNTSLFGATRSTWPMCRSSDMFQATTRRSAASDAMGT